MSSYTCKMKAIYSHALNNLNNFILFLIKGWNLEVINASVKCIGMLKRPYDEQAFIGLLTSLLEEKVDLWYGDRRPNIFLTYRSS